MPAAKFQILRKCPIYGNEFIAKTIESYYCSSTCSMSLSFAVLFFIFFWFCLFGRATCFMLQAALR